jgi:hypothetical protein
MNQPAFPVEVIYTQENERFNGMTLRDYFAARALPAAIKEMNDAESFQIDDAAIVAYQYADSMMRVRGL